MIDDGWMTAGYFVTCGCLVVDVWCVVDGLVVDGLCLVCG
jgi:hypothetical protein